MARVRRIERSAADRIGSALQTASQVGFKLEELNQQRKDSEIKRGFLMQQQEAFNWHRFNAELGRILSNPSPKGRKAQLDAIGGTLYEWGRKGGASFNNQEGLTNYYNAIEGPIAEAHTKLPSLQLRAAQIMQSPDKSTPDQKSSTLSEINFTLDQLIGAYAGIAPEVAKKYASDKKELNEKFSPLVEAAPGLVTPEGKPISKAKAGIQVGAGARVTGKPTPSGDLTLGAPAAEGPSELEIFRTLKLSESEKKKFDEFTASLNAVGSIQRLLKSNPELRDFIGSNRAAYAKFLTNSTIKTIGAAIGLNPEQQIDPNQRLLIDQTEKMFQQYRKVITGVQAGFPELEALRKIIPDLLRTPEQFESGLNLIEKVLKVDKANKIVDAIKSRPDKFRGEFAKLLPRMDPETAAIAQEIMETGKVDPSRFGLDNEGNFTGGSPAPSPTPKVTDDEVDAIFNKFTKGG